MNAPNFLDVRLPDRFWSRVQPCPTSGCWLWVGATKPSGYGTFQVGSSTLTAHRHSFTILASPIPPGLQLDHLCRVRCCVNPAHLEPVTNQENQLRGFSPTGENARKTHCDNGHEYTPENTYWQAGGKHRRCRACGHASDARHRAKKRASDPPS